MAYRLYCPCGERLHGRDEDQMVEQASRHLAQIHSDRSYSPTEIMSMAVEIDERLLPDDLP